MPRNPGQITLRREAWTVPEHYAFGDDQIVPLRAGAQVAWKLVSA
jgi:dihydroorotase